MKQLKTDELTNELGDIFYRCIVTEGYVYQDWYGDFVTLDDVIAGSAHGLNTIRDYGHKAMINDNSHLAGSWDHANDWIAAEWLPKAVELGLTKLAHIVSADVFTTISANEMCKNVGATLEMRLFGDFESAEAWALE